MAMCFSSLSAAVFLSSNKAASPEILENKKNVFFDLKCTF
jgi:hypothetical protein